VSAGAVAMYSLSKPNHHIKVLVSIRFFTGMHCNSEKRPSTLFTVVVVLLS
jgi:hypothetical protein